MEYILIEENKSGEAFIISKKSTINKIINLMDVRLNVEGYSYKILTVNDAKNHKKLVGQKYLSELN